MCGGRFGLNEVESVESVEDDVLLEDEEDIDLAMDRSTMGRTGGE